MEGKTGTKKYVDTFMRDVTALGGGFFSFFLVALLYIIGKSIVAGQLFLGFFLIYPTVGFIRSLHFKPRPRPESYTNAIERIDASSFPSIHSANSFYVAYVLHNAFTSNPASVFLFLLATAIAYTRVYFKKHYPVDVVGGAFVGLGMAYLTITYIIPS